MCICQCKLNFKERCIRFLFKQINYEKLDSCWNEVLGVFRKYQTELLAQNENARSCVCNYRQSNLRKMLLLIPPENVEIFWVAMINVLEKYM